MQPCDCIGASFLYSGVFVEVPDKLDKGKRLGMERAGFAPDEIQAPSRAFSGEREGEELSAFAVLLRGLSGDDRNAEPGGDQIFDALLVVESGGDAKRGEI